MGALDSGGAGWVLDGFWMGLVAFDTIFGDIWRGLVGCWQTDRRAGPQECCSSSVARTQMRGEQNRAETTGKSRDA